MTQEQAWGQWDDSAPYFVGADGRTPDEAKVYLEALVDAKDAGVEAVLVKPEAFVKRVWDCDFEGPHPCDWENCQHDHEVLVYQFELADVEPARGDTQ